MKKIAFIFLAMLLPMLAYGATTKFQVGGISYETLEDDPQAVKVVSGNLKYSGDVVIPATVTSGGKTYTVKKIGQWAFWECTGLKSIVLPEGLVEIENSSFTGCTGLKALAFPSSLISIDGYVFSGDRGAFEGCTGLKSIYFPASMKTNDAFDANIGWLSFYNCTSLKTIYVAGSDTHIAMYDVFGGCNAVTDFVSCIENPKAHWVDARSFQGFIETANLIVPNGKKNDYMDANDWYLFKHIYERSSYTKAFAIVTANQGGKVAYGNEDVTIGTQVWGITKGQSASFTITPNDGHKLLKLLKDGQDVTSSVSNGTYTVSNVQSDFTLEAVFEEGTTPGPQPQTEDKGTAKLSIESFDIKAGETKTMRIAMQNPEDQVTLVQFDLRLPSGLSIATGDDAIDIAGRTTWKKHTLTSNTADGITRFLLYSSTNAVIEGTSGAVISVKLVASSSFNGGDIKFENQLMTTPSLVESKPATYTYKIKGSGNPPVGDGITFACPVTEAICLKNWDSNGDGKLSKQEAAAVTTLGKVFKETDISSFDELKYFTGISAIEFGEFSDCNKLVSISLPDGVKKIGQNAFICAKLTSISFPHNNGFSFDIHPFQSCTALTAITLPKNLVGMNGSPFIQCYNLKEIIVDADNAIYKSVDGVVYTKGGETIMSYPNGKEQEEYNIIDGALSIAAYAFAYSKYLKKVNIPSSVYLIASSAFADCRELTTLQLPDGLEEIPGYMLSWTSKIQSVSIPGSVKRINDHYAFAGCGLTSIELPASLEYIGHNAFYDDDMTKVVSHITSPFAINKNVFTEKTYNSATLYVPKGTKALYETTNGWNNFRNIVEIDDTGIGSGPTSSLPFDVYSLKGTMVKKGATSLKALPKGVYIVNGHKVIVK